VVSQNKLKKGDSHLSLEMERTPDILEEVGKRKGNKILVGFAAETENLVANARKKMMEKNLDLMIANDVSKPGTGFGYDTNQIKLLYPTGEVKDFPLMFKEEVSERILDEVLKFRRK